MTVPIRHERVSIIIPVTERCDPLVALYEEYRAAIAQATSDFEFIFVLDGDYGHLARELTPLKAQGNVRVLQLSRQFGEAALITAGFEFCSGGRVMTLPAYRQVTPERIGELLAELKDADMTIACRWPRRDGVINRLQSSAFNFLMRWMTGAQFHDLGCGARAFDRRVLEEVRLYGDQHRFFPLLATRQGFRVKEVRLPQSDHDTSTRVYGPGVYARRLLDILTILFLTKFTRKPLRFFGLIGVTLLVAGVIALTWIAVQRLVFYVGLGDRPALLLSTLLIVLGVQILALGLIGELIIFTHASELREYQVAEVVQAPDQAEPAAQEQAEPAAVLRETG